MKRIACEMCGNSDLVKQDGVFVCQYCGCKYSVEEVRKMVIDGTVDVTGSTVKVDTSGELANLYQLARRARKANNGKDAARYYDMILIKDPTSWEAAFYFNYYTSPGTIAKNLDGVFTLIQEHVAPDEQTTAVKEIANRIYMHGAGLLSQFSCGNKFDCGKEIIRHFENSPELVKAGINICKQSVASCDPNYDKDKIPSFVDQIGEYDPAYKAAYYEKIESEAKKRQLENDISRIEKSLPDLYAKAKEESRSSIKLLIIGILILIAPIVFWNFGIRNLETLYLVSGVFFFIGIVGLLHHKASKAKIKETLDDMQAKKSEVDNLSKKISGLAQQMTVPAIE